MVLGTFHGTSLQKSEAEREGTEEGQADDTKKKEASRDWRGGWGVASGQQPKAEISTSPVFQEKHKILIVMWKFLIIRFSDLLIFKKTEMNHIRRLSLSFSSVPATARVQGRP